MASARELLEQADALMQRNRRGPRDDEIPELTDAVPDDALPRGGWTDAVPAREPAAAPPSVDDIPELTEAVEEIEAPSIQEYPDDPDELSRWLQEEEPKIAPRDREAPAAMPVREVPRAFAPDVSQMPGRPPGAMMREDARPEPDAEDRVAEVLPMPSPPAVEAATAAAEEIFLDEVPVPAPTDETDEDGSIDSGTATRAEGVASGARDAAESGADVDGFAVEAPGDAGAAGDLAPAAVADVDEVEAIAANAAAPHVPALYFAAELPPAESGRLETRSEIPAPEPLPAAQAAQSAITEDPERWNALAEEIRMQVLQRIDIFTDTGLREQLTARLQPVVDRASADLVATINREVGQMLRAYVAEAIEREIERWRHGGA